MLTSFLKIFTFFFVTEISSYGMDKIYRYWFNAEMPIEEVPLLSPFLLLLLLMLSKNVGGKFKI